MDFLRKGHVGFEEDDDAQEVINALRSDCLLYEDFKRPNEFPVLPVPATICRGGDDPFHGPNDMDGWRDEFEGPINEVVLDGVGHHIYSDAGAEMAQLLMDLIEKYHRE
jgi:surfactin synthase thioesterase subunit